MYYIDVMIAMFNIYVPVMILCYIIIGIIHFISIGSSKSSVNLEIKYINWICWRHILQQADITHLISHCWKWLAHVCHKGPDTGHIPAEHKSKTPDTLFGIHTTTLVYHKVIYQFIRVWWNDIKRVKCTFFLDFKIA